MCTHTVPYITAWVSCYLVVLYGMGSNAASYIFVVCGSDQFISCMAYHSLVSFLCGICACKVLKLR